MSLPIPRPAPEDLKSASWMRADIVAPEFLSHVRKFSEAFEKSLVSMSSAIVREVRELLQSAHASRREDVDVGC